MNSPNEMAACLYLMPFALNCLKRIVAAIKRTVEAMLLKVVMLAQYQYGGKIARSKDDAIAVFSSKFSFTSMKNRRMPSAASIGVMYSITHIPAFAIAP